MTRETLSVSAEDDNCKNKMFYLLDSNYKNQLESIQQFNNRDKVHTELQKDKQRRKSISRITNVLRDFQITVRTKLSKNNEPVNEEIIHRRRKGRSNSLPYIKETKNHVAKRALTFNVFSVIEEVEQSKDSYNSDDSYFNASENIDNFIKQTSKCIICNENQPKDFTLKRHNSYKQKQEKSDKISEEELEKINRRRRQGRSKSAQLPQRKFKDLERRKRSLSDICDDTPFKDIIAQRLELSRETPLCSTEL